MSLSLSALPEMRIVTNSVITKVECSNVANSYFMVLVDCICEGATEFPDTRPPRWPTGNYDVMNTSRAKNELMLHVW